MEWTSETLERDLQEGKLGCFIALGANKEIIGLVLYWYSYAYVFGRILVMEVLFVKTEYRNLGVGSALVQAVAKVILLF